MLSDLRVSFRGEGYICGICEARGRGRFGPERERKDTLLHDDCARPTVGGPVYEHEISEGRLARLEAVSWGKGTRRIEDLQAETEESGLQRRRRQERGVQLTKQQDRR